MRTPEHDAGVRGRIPRTSLPTWYVGAIIWGVVMRARDAERVASRWHCELSSISK